MKFARRLGLIHAGMTWAMDERTRLDLELRPLGPMPDSDLIQTSRELMLVEEPGSNEILIHLYKTHDGKYAGGILYAGGGFEGLHGEDDEILEKIQDKIEGIA